MPSSSQYPCLSHADCCSQFNAVPVSPLQVLMAPAGVMKAPAPGFAVLQRAFPTLLTMMARGGPTDPPPGDFYDAASVNVAALQQWDLDWHRAHSKVNGTAPSTLFWTISSRFFCKLYTYTPHKIKNWSGDFATAFWPTAAFIPSLQDGCIFATAFWPTAASLSSLHFKTGASSSLQAHNTRLACDMLYFVIPVLVGC